MGIESFKSPKDSNAPESNPEQQAKVYDQIGGGRYDQEAMNRGWQVPKIAYESLSQHLKKGQRLIDFGAGTGLSAEPFQEAELEMRGIDGSKELLKAAEEKGVYDLGTEQAIIGRDELGISHDYDYAISFGTMSIIPSAKQALIAAMQESVKPDGRVAFNYLDPEDYPDIETTQNENGDLVDNNTIGQEQQRFFHRRDDIATRCQELYLVIEDEIEAVSYPQREEGKQNPTRIIIARYSPTA